MGKDKHDHETERVDAAFNRVLAAESEARERVAACRREAAAIASGVTERTRRIADLADRRMQLAHRVADRGVERVLADLALPAVAPPAGAAELDMQARLERAVAALADEILGPSPELGPEQGPSIGPSSASEIAPETGP
jgi:hypothetical protein